MEGSKSTVKATKFSYQRKRGSIKALSLAEGVVEFSVPRTVGSVAGGVSVEFVCLFKGLGRDVAGSALPLVGRRPPTRKKRKEVSARVDRPPMVNASKRAFKALPCRW